MSDPAAHKRLVADFLDAMAQAEGAEIDRVLARYCHPDAVWRIFHPFNTLEGAGAAAEEFWRPLKAAFPDYEQRLGLCVAGRYEERDWVSTLGHLMGTFWAPWLGIPATAGLTFLRFGLMAEIRDGLIARAYIYLDIVDVMRQAGVYPLRRMPGSAEQWPLSPIGAGGPIGHHDAAIGAETMRIVREMQLGLGKGDDLKNLAGTIDRHSPHWHGNMNWYGPAGIGSSRGQRGFLDYHGALFIQAFPDRAGIVRSAEGEEHRPGHFIRAGDGRFAVTGGWPSLYGTHLGAAWLGVPPTGKAVEMRVADWYRIDDQDKIIDNWVMIDIPHILHQVGLDLLEDLKYFVDPKLPRWPRP